MASEPNIVEIYVDPTTKSILEYVPAADVVLNGGVEEPNLPEDAIFIVQINIDQVVQDRKAHLIVKKDLSKNYQVLDEDDGYHD